MRREYRWIFLIAVLVIVSTVVCCPVRVVAAEQSTPTVSVQPDGTTELRYADGTRKCISPDNRLMVFDKDGKQIMGTASAELIDDYIGICEDDAQTPEGKQSKIDNLLGVENGSGQSSILFVDYYLDREDFYALTSSGRTSFGASSGIGTLGSVGGALASSFGTISSFGNTSDMMAILRLSTNPYSATPYVDPVQATSSRGGGVAPPPRNSNKVVPLNWLCSIRNYMLSEIKKNTDEKRYQKVKDIIMEKDPITAINDLMGLLIK